MRKARVSPRTVRVTLRNLYGAIDLTKPIYAQITEYNLNKGMLFMRRKPEACALPTSKAQILDAIVPTEGMEVQKPARRPAPRPHVEESSTGAPG